MRGTVDIDTKQPSVASNARPVAPVPQLPDLKRVMNHGLLGPASWTRYRLMATTCARYR